MPVPPSRPFNAMRDFAPVSPPTTNAMREYATSYLAMPPESGPANAMAAAKPADGFGNAFAAHVRNAMQPDQAAPKPADGGGNFFADYVRNAMQPDQSE